MRVFRIHALPGFAGGRRARGSIETRGRKTSRWGKIRRTGKQEKRIPPEIPLVDSRAHALRCAVSCRDSTRSHGRAGVQWKAEQSRGARPLECFLPHSFRLLPWIPEQGFPPSETRSPRAASRGTTARWEDPPPPSIETLVCSGA